MATELRLNFYNDLSFVSFLFALVPSEDAFYARQKQQCDKHNPVVKTDRLFSFLSHAQRARPNRFLSTAAQLNNNFANGRLFFDVLKCLAIK
jgi:hypothetical protein